MGRGLLSDRGGKQSVCTNKMSCHKTHDYDILKWKVLDIIPFQKESSVIPPLPCYTYCTLTKPLSQPHGRGWPPEFTVFMLGPSEMHQKTHTCHRNVSQKNHMWYECFKAQPHESTLLFFSRRKTSPGNFFTPLLVHPEKIQYSKWHGPLQSIFEIVHRQATWFDVNDSWFCSLA